MAGGLVSLKRVLPRLRKDDHHGGPHDSNTHNIKGNIEDEVLNDINPEECIPDRSNLPLLPTLPFELQAEVLRHLRFLSILSLRLTSRSLSTLVDSHTGTIARFMLSSPTTTLLSIGPDEDFRYCLHTLYPIPTSQTNLNFHYVLSLHHTHRIVHSTLHTFVNFVETDFTFLRNQEQRKRYSGYRERLTATLRGPMLVVQHYLSTLSTIPNPSHTTLVPIIQSYSLPLLPNAYPLLATLLSLFRRHLRAPSYAGTLERHLRRWHRRPPSHATALTAFVFGNLDLVRNVLECRGTQGTLGDRIDMVEDFVLSQKRPGTEAWTFSIDEAFELFHATVHARLGIEKFRSGSEEEILDMCRTIRRIVTESGGDEEDPDDGAESGTALAGPATI